jgi:hypothetical protein
MLPFGIAERLGSKMRKRQPLAADIVRALGVVGCYAVACQGSRASILLMG